MESKEYNRSNKIKSQNIFFYILFLSMRFLDFIIPKKDNIWIFGSHNGNGFGDNSRSLFEYLSLEKKEGVRPIWLTKDRKILSSIQSKKFEAYHFFSIRGVYYSLICKIVIISHSFLDVGLIPFLFPKKIKIIQLWHGTPLKKLENFRFTFLKQKLMDLFLLYIERDCDLLFSATELNSEIYKRKFNVLNEQIKITGQPRNDVLCSGNRVNNKEKIVLFMPTWREYDTEFSFFSIKCGFNLCMINNFLNKHNARLIIKMHHADKEKLTANIFSDRITLYDNEKDLYEFLTSADVLMTDYSSVYFDFLLLNKPIVFTPFDLEEYSNKRGFYYDYNSVSPGCKAYDWIGVLDCLNKIFSDKDDFADNRALVAKKFNKYLDGSSSKRVFEEIIKS